MCLFAGEGSQSAPISPEWLEIQLPGSPLCSMGCAVEAGGFSSIWLPRFKGVDRCALVRLSRSQQERIWDTVQEGTGMVDLNVSDFCPKMSGQDFVEVRKYIRARGKCVIQSVDIINSIEEWYEDIRRYTPQFRFTMCPWEQLEGTNLEVVKREFDTFRKRVLAKQKAGKVDAGGVTAPAVEIAPECTVHAAKDEPAAEKEVTFGESTVVEVTPHKGWDFEIEDIEEELKTLESEVEVNAVGVAGVREHIICRNVVVTPDHLLTHHPADPNCDVCKQCKTLKKPFVRGSSTVESPPGMEHREPLMVDWILCSKTASDGSRVVGLVYHPKSKFLWATCAPRRAMDTPAKAVQEARVQFKIDTKPFWLRGDRDVVHTSIETLKWLERAHDDPVLEQCPQGVFVSGVPHNKTTNSIIENKVKLVEYGAKCQLYASGMPVNCWHLAVQCFVENYNYREGWRPVKNVIKPRALGQLGMAVLPPFLTKLHEINKLEPRLVPVAYLGLALHTTGGVKVTFRSPKTGKCCKTIVLDRDIVWRDSYAFERKVANLQFISGITKTFDPFLGVTSNMVGCDVVGCGKWRFVRDDQFAELEDQPAVTCRMMGYRCQDPEDRRVNKTVNDLSEEEAAEVEAMPEGPTDLERNVVQEADFLEEDPADAAEPEYPEYQRQLDSPPPDQGVAAAAGVAPPPGLGPGDDGFLPPLEEAQAVSIGQSGQAAASSNEPPPEPPVSRHKIHAVMLQKIESLIAEESALAEEQHGPGADAEILRQRGLSEFLARSTQWTNSFLAYEESNDPLSPEQIEVAQAVCRVSVNYGSSVRATSVNRVRLAQKCELNAAAILKNQIKVYAVIVKNGEALKRDNVDRGLWVAAIDKEFRALVDEGVLAVVKPEDLKDSDEVLPSLLVLNIKADGRHKARIVACGNYQEISQSECYSSSVPD